MVYPIPHFFIPFVLSTFHLCLFDSQQHIKLTTHVCLVKHLPIFLKLNLLFVDSYLLIFFEYLYRVKFASFIHIFDLVTPKSIYIIIALWSNINKFSFVIIFTVYVFVLFQLSFIDTINPDKIYFISKAIQYISTPIRKPILNFPTECNNLTFCIYRACTLFYAIHIISNIPNSRFERKLTFSMLLSIYKGPFILSKIADELSFTMKLSILIKSSYIGNLFFSYFLSILVIFWFSPF